MKAEMLLYAKNQSAAIRRRAEAEYLCAGRRQRAFRVTMKTRAGEMQSESQFI